jgi:alkaline phosphatase D
MRRETLKGILVTALLIVLPLVFISSGREKSGRIPGSYVVLVSMDAFRWDYSDIYKTPNLDKMAAGGVKADRLISSFPTNTFPNHYSIATVFIPDYHGIVNNTFYAPDLGLLYRNRRKERCGESCLLQENRCGYSSEAGLIAAFFTGWVLEAPVAGMHPYYWKNMTKASAMAIASTQW